MFDIDEDFPVPKPPGDFLPGDNLAMFGNQEDEEFERLPLKLEPAAFAAKLKFAGMKAEFAESIDGKGHQFSSRGWLKYSIGENLSSVVPL